MVLFFEVACEGIADGFVCVVLPATVVVVLADVVVDAVLLASVVVVVVLADVVVDAVLLALVVVVVVDTPSNLLYIFIG